MRYDNQDILNLQESNTNNEMLREGARVCDNCQCYACRRMDHIAKFHKYQPAHQEGWPIQRRPFNNLDWLEYE